MDFWKAGLGKGPGGHINPLSVELPGASEEHGKGSRRAGACRVKRGEGRLPGGPVYSHFRQITFQWDESVL